ncbi:common central domain of tyrosinase-domain-containing protein [Suillus fuscotomentosus]|uniref:Common central domain of tyrosinase-domain-containing protein n=1 Tax=Suillus fuscotomentosus TaxID=1912939 RepID=A0AAD4E5F0_9AGAM|nr:common central domain of tyrosinase-domain-containing protein [Suillus fuscotomentosus]KAG1899611.1 common central domain of tyrosinase-domain-containing protein [Suillus fuscotomentosus]
MNTVEYHYPVIGRKGTGGVFDRLPIETLEKDHPYQFALFILAFAAIQQRPDALQVMEEPAGTFMEIASIHGRPFIEWAGDRNNDTSTDYSATDKKDTDPVPARFRGYCNHGAVVFPTWHRPYVMLIEQSIGNIADQLAHDIEAKNPHECGVWVKAAKELRFPYWGWAEKDVSENGLPPVLYEDKVEIMAAGGQKQIIDNPLSFFSFVDEIPSDFGDETLRTGQVAYFSKWHRTYRYAVSTANPEGTDLDFIRAFKAGAKDLRNKVAQLFVVNDNEDSALAWDEFSNHTMQLKREMDNYNFGSLEGVHDAVHTLGVGDIHLFQSLKYAYCSNDLGWNWTHDTCRAPQTTPPSILCSSFTIRMWTDLALWEWCYTEYWMESGYEIKGQSYPWTQQLGTYAQVYNAQLLPDGPLQPFRTEQGDYWTSSQARFLHADAYPKYYSYPELAGVKVNQAPMSSDERALARKKIAAYYRFDPQTTAQQVAAPAWTQLPVPDNNHPAVPADHAVIPEYRTFAVHVKLLEHAFNGSYSFQLYHKGNDNSQLIGTVAVFARPDHSPCKACTLRREAGTVIHGVIPIPPALIESIMKSNADGETVATFDQTLTLSYPIYSRFSSGLRTLRSGPVRSYSVFPLPGVSVMLITGMITDPLTYVSFPTRV